MQGLRSNPGRLLVLTLLHFVVDFCGGLTIPLPEPTLVQHLDTTLPLVALLVGGFAVVVNIVQPLSGFLLPRRGLPILLLLAPLAAGMVPLIGLTDTIAGTAALLLVAGIGIGVLHPEAALAAHSLAGRRRGLGMSLFMAGGYAGFSLGSLAAGVWAEWRGLDAFWFWCLPAVAVTLLVLASGVHRLEGHMDDAPGEQAGPLPAGPVLALAACIAVNMCLLVRFLPILMVRRFPGQDPQGWAGAAVFATGIAGAVGAFAWGHLSEGRSRAMFIATMQLAAIPFLAGLVFSPSPQVAPFWGLGVGCTMGAVFPLSVVLARESRGLGRRLRMGLAIGGAWGLGELAFIAGSRYVGHFPAGSVVPVRHVLAGCGVLLVVTALLGFVLCRRERQAIAVDV